MVREGIVNLVVHKTNVELARRQCMENQDFNLVGKIDGALKEIRDVLSSPSTIDYDHFCFDRVFKELKTKKERSLVILYGGHRDLCLEEISRYLIEEGFPVAYSIHGTI